MKSTINAKITGKKMVPLDARENSLEYFPKNNIVKKIGESNKNIAANHLDFLVP